MVMALPFALVVLAFVLRTCQRDEVYAATHLGSLPGPGWPVRPAALLPTRPQPWTQPPAGLSVADVAYLAYPDKGTAAALATVVDLAQRGHLRISVIRRRPFRQKAWQIAAATGAPNGLSAYETRVLTSVVGAPNMRHRLSRLAPAVDTSTALARGWLRPAPFARWAMLVLWATMVVVGVVAYRDVGWLGLAVVLIGGVIASGIAWRPHTRTALGSALHAQVRGFRLHLTTQQLHQPGRLAREQFAAHLPYAVALGVAGPWLTAARAAGITEIDGLDVSGLDDALSAFDDFADSLCDLGGDGGDGGDGGGGD